MLWSTVLYVLCSLKRYVLLFYICKLKMYRRLTVLFVEVGLLIRRVVVRLLAWMNAAA